MITITECVWANPIICICRYYTSSQLLQFIAQATCTWYFSMISPKCLPGTNFSLAAFHPDYCSNLFLCLGYPATVMFLYLMLNLSSPYFSFLSTKSRHRHHIHFSVCFLMGKDPQTLLKAQSFEPTCWSPSFSCTFMDQRNAVFISNRTTTIALVV